MSTAADVVAALKRQGMTIAVAESLTGGLVVAELVAIPGASEVVRGGIVAYATDLKATLLGVDPDLLEASGPIHLTVAEQMASGVRERTGADVGIATTGVAGPDPQDGHAPGEVWLGFATPVGVQSQRLELVGDRDQIRRGTVDALLGMLAVALGE